ncbi:MAG: S9 family peptidase [Phycisphaerae bacterium]|nr:S9 family peptidase [Phycisphaerae bacterium]
MPKRIILTIIFAFFITNSVIFAQEKVKKQDTKVEKSSHKVTLKEMFPDKYGFGPSAKDMTFSHDGKYAAWLYRPADEVRHGNDIYLMSTETGKITRITYPSVLAKFQSSSRKVVEDRKNKAKKVKTEEIKDSDTPEQKKAIKEIKALKERGDWVSSKDPDDSRAPRYSGISSYYWAPNTQEMLFSSEGDIYRFDFEKEKITRLTQTQQRESSIQWLPDGDGYICSRDKSYFITKFNSSYVRQLDPKFPSGQELGSLNLSPDGKWIAFATYRQTKEGQYSKVDIAQYRSRLMQSREVTRQVSDDAPAHYEQQIYLYKISENFDEKDDLKKVFSINTTAIGDIITDPVWAPDSTKIAFLTFMHATSLVQIHQAQITDNKPEQAKQLVKFFHNGGPNTPRMMELFYLADNKRILYNSEQSGFRHLHILDPLYENMKPLTSGPFEVYPLGLSKNRKWVYVQTTKVHPSQKDVYKVSVQNGKMVRMTFEKGTYASPAIAPDGTMVLSRRSAFNFPGELVKSDLITKKETTLTDSHTDEAKKWAQYSPEFFDFINRHGHKLYGSMFKPEDCKKTDKRPLLIYFYGGPLGTTKQASQPNFGGEAYGFPLYMTQNHGYITCTIDTRGNSGYAGIFEKANYNQVGKPQVEDIVDCVNYFVKNHGADPKRVGIHGWSFGGFQTQMCMYTEPEVFAAGIAGAGPTEWENYNSWYTTHTIGKSEPGQATLKKFSLVPLAKNLKGNLLLVHGMEDSNVLYQDTMQVYRELLKNGKETLVELFLDPTGGHGLGGDVNSRSRFKKYEQFLLRTLGTYQPETPAAKQKTDKKPKSKANNKNKEKNIKEDLKKIIADEQQKVIEAFIKKESQPSHMRWG